jgi:transcriptional regulator with XRE-family HTH domain
MAEPSARSHRKLKDRKTFLRLLRQVREEAHLRQSDVAKALGSTQAYVSKYELGERRLDLLDLSAVCEAVGIPLLEFVRRFQEARTRS